MLGLSKIGRSAEQESEVARRVAEEKSEAMRQEKQIADETLKKLEEAQHTESQRRWAAEGIAQTNQSYPHALEREGYRAL